MDTVGEDERARERRQFWRIARAVALGILMAVAVLALVGSCMAEEARDDCKTENIYREAEGLPPRLC